MPTYDYQCDSCEHQFEAFQSMRDDALRVCPECNKESLRRLITGGAGVIFKGSGFYVNDSKKNDSGSRSGAKSGSETPSAPGASSSNESGSSGGSNDSGSSSGDSSASSGKNGSSDKGGSNGKSGSSDKGGSNGKSGPSGKGGEKKTA